MSGASRTGRWAGKLAGTMNHKLLIDAAERGARYLDGIPGRRAYPATADIERLDQALRAPMPAGPTEPADVLAFIDQYGSPAAVASPGGSDCGVRARRAL